MCEISSKLIFCSCPNKNSHTPIMGEYEWTLDRYIGSRASKMLGKIMRPSSELGTEIQIDNIITAMNTRNCFDFDYIPQERDSFQINNGLKYPDYKYFSLIFLNEKWQEGRNPSFGKTISENIAKGKVKQIKE